MFKKCDGCKKEKHISEYHEYTLKNRWYKCKPCMREYKKNITKNITIKIQIKAVQKAGNIIENFMQNIRKEWISATKGFITIIKK